MTALASNLMTALSTLSVSSGLPPRHSITDSKRLLETASDGNMTSARRHLALGYAHLLQDQTDEAIAAFYKARSLASEDMGPRGHFYALATWALADAHVLSRSYAKAEELFSAAVELFVRSGEIGSQELSACLKDFKAFAGGILRQSALESQIDGMLKLASLSRV